MAKFGSVCSGIESASVAWEPLGFEPVWFSEIEKFPSAVLAHHWPKVPNLGDMCNLPTLVGAGFIEPPDVLIGGTPCQAFSVAGLRKGLDDERGQLTLKFVELADEIDRKRPDDECVVVWENVPGVLISKDNAFGCFLGALAGSGDTLQPGEPPAVGKSSNVWKWVKESNSHVPRWPNSGIVYGPKRTIAWRVLDAQYFGVAQRRRRVFVVASSRKGFDPGAVLFESDGLRRDTPPSRETGQIVAALTARGVGTCGADDNQAQAGHLIADDQKLFKRSGFGDFVEDDVSGVLMARSYKDADNIVVHAIQNATRGKSQNGLGIAPENDPMYTLDVGSQHGVAVCGGNSNLVRRLTPVECERLQGFPDNHTLIPWDGKLANECPDGHRYKAIGNSKAVPVVKWLGVRLKAQLNQQH